MTAVRELSFWFDSDSAYVDEILEHMVSLGIGYVGPSTFAAHGDDSAVEALRSRVHAAGLKFSTYHSAVGLVFVEPGQEAREIADCRRQVDVAAHLGAGTVVFHHDCIRGYPDGRDEYWIHPRDIAAAHEQFGRPQFDPVKPMRVKLGMFSGFMHGATHIYNESDHFCPTHKWPREIDDPMCVETRKHLREFYEFTQTHSRPAGFARTNVAFMRGHLDGWCGCNTVGVSDVLWGQEQFKTGCAEHSWELLDVVFPQYLKFDALNEGWFNGTPYGQVDIVPISASAEALGEYELLAFLGWNTMTDDAHDKLLAHARDGGTVFMSLPHTYTHTKPTAPCEEILFNGGDLAELFGVKVGVVHTGGQPDEMGLTTMSNPLQAVTIMSPSCYGFEVGKQFYTRDTLEIPVEVIDGQVIAEGNTGQPILVCKEFASGGRAFLLISPDYPDTYKRLMRHLLAKMLEHHQIDIRVTGSDEVNLAVYGPEGEEVVYLMNTNLHKAADCVLDIRGQLTPLSLEPGQF